jgi:hypothetical protein
MLLRLKPLDDSYDQVLVCDETGQVMGALHVEAFRSGLEDGAIFERLWDGEECVVSVSLVEALAATSED